jgi:hypothetical protein
MIKKYFFGVTATGEFKEGNVIHYEGEWQGRKYTGKGKILKIQPLKMLRHTYWSDLSGHADQPQNYHIITYDLKEMDGGTEVTLTEENLATDEMSEQSSKLWDLVFDNLVELVERQDQKVPGF